MIAMFLTSASNHSLTAILVSRFLINLQAVHQQQTDSESTQCSRATLVFERVVGSLGESLDAETYEYDTVKSPLSVDVEVVEVDSREERRGESMEMTPVSPSSGCAERSSV